MCESQEKNDKKMFNYPNIICKFISVFPAASCGDLE